MRSITLPLPAFGFVVGTRAALGAGLGLLLGSRLSDQKRRKVGLALAGIGALTTIPAVRLISRSLCRGRSHRAIESDERLVGATRYPRKGDDLL